jgi:hypothetical protein
MAKLPIQPVCAIDASAALLGRSLSIGIQFRCETFLSRERIACIAAIDNHRYAIQCGTIFHWADIVGNALSTRTAWSFLATRSESTAR